MGHDFLAERLDLALNARTPLLQTMEARDGQEIAVRLFNGFLEGYPDLVVDRYACTLVLYSYAEDRLSAQLALASAQAFLLEKLPWVQAVVFKDRTAVNEAERRGVVVYGTAACRRVREHGVWYAVDLTLNMDASLYLDTRELRAWAINKLAGKRVLNTFAYTGSLGVAARAGGASEVLHVDLNRRFLNIAKDSYALNGFPVQRRDFLAGDFWAQVNGLKRSGQLFDCVFVDPPFFSSTAHGKVDLLGQSHRVINKVRPLVAHQGWLVAINNALFLSGEAFLGMLQDLCADGYMEIETLLDAPPDFAGFPDTRLGTPPADPAPFNHSTKIAILRVRRKDARTAGLPASHLEA
jgi:23S rRNA (cytosine1962-C5)-methyltransferase